MLDNNEETVLQEWESMISSESSHASTDPSLEDRGIKSLLEKAMQSYEKLPMLEIVFDRLVRLLTTSFRNLTSETVEIQVINYQSLRFGTYMDTIPNPSLITVFKCLEWENFGLLLVNSSLTFCLVEILFGGKKSNSPSTTNQLRPHTDIEQALVKQISEVVLNELGASFDPISPATFSYDRMEINPNFVTIARPADAAILVQLKVDIEDRHGQIDLLIPYATLEPIKSLLTQVFMGERLGSDSEWEELLVEKIHHVNIELEATYLPKQATLQQVSRLKVGHTIVLDHEIDDDIIVKSNGVELFKVRMGQVEDRIAIKILDTMINKE